MTPMRIFRAKNQAFEGPTWGLVLILWACYLGFWLAVASVCYFLGTLLGCAGTPNYPVPGDPEPRMYEQQENDPAGQHGYVDPSLLARRKTGN